MQILRLFSIYAVLILHLNSFSASNKASLYVTKTKKTKNWRLKNVTNELNSSLKVQNVAYKKA